MPSSESFHFEDPSHTQPDSTHPESRLTLNELSPSVKSLAINLSEQILAICRKHGIETILDVSIDSNLSKAVSSVVEQFIEKLPSDRLLMQDAERLIELQRFLTTIHEQNSVPINPEFVSTTKEEAMRGGVLYYKGDLDLTVDSDPSNSKSSYEEFLFPKIVEGNVSFFGPGQAKWLRFPETVGGDLRFDTLMDPAEVIFPITIGGSLYIGDVDTMRGLVLPKTVGGEVFIGSIGIFHRGQFRDDKNILRAKYPDLRIR